MDNRCSSAFYLYSLIAEVKHRLPVVCIAYTNKNYCLVVCTVHCHIKSSPIKKWSPQKTFGCQNWSPHCQIQSPSSRWWFCFVSTYLLHLSAQCSTV